MMHLSCDPDPIMVVLVIDLVALQH